MSKLTKKDFDTYFGKEPFYSDKDKERFFKHLNHPDKKSKHLFPKLATVFILFGLFLLGPLIFKDNLSILDFSQNQKHLFTNGDRQYANSIEEVEAYYEHMTPGFKRAKELGLVTNVNKTVQLTDNRTLNIDKIWYNSDEVFIFYNIGLTKKLANDQAGPTLTRMKLYSEQDLKIPDQTLSFYTKNMTQWEGIVHENRFYHRLVSTPIRSESNQAIEEIDETIRTDITISLHDENINLSDIEIPFIYDKNKEPIYTFQLEQEVGVKDAQVSFQQLDIGVANNQLTGEILLPDGYFLSMLNVEVTTNKGESFTAFGSNEDENTNTFTINFPGLNTVPDDIDVNIKSLEIVGEDHFEFSIDVSDYEQRLSVDARYEDTVHRPITTIRDTAVFLERLYYDDRGINFDIKYEPKDKNQQVQLLAASPSTRSEAQRYDGNLYNIVSALNEKEEQGEFGQRGHGPGQQFGIFIDKQFVEASKQIDITIENLLYQVGVDQSITIPVNID